MLRTIALLAFLAPAALPQTAADPRSFTLGQKEAFLKDAKVISSRSASKGITNTVRATLSDGKITHDASIQTIDERKVEFQGTQGRELNFRDSYRFNIAAYRLARLLGLGGMVPPSVERTFRGRYASFTWWVDDVIGDEEDRLRKKVVFPPGDSYARQVHIRLVFHQLIYNVDPNQGNTLYDKDYRLWMIDHSRAFRLYTTLQDEKALLRCDSQLLAKLKQLDDKTLKAEIGKLVGPGEIKGLLARRDRIVAHFEKLGPESLYTWLPEQ
jgi:hypothetical protein